MDNPKIREIVKKIRLREERFESVKRNRRVSFADMCVGQDDNSEDLCIFKATKIKERELEWPEEQDFKPDLYVTVLESLKDHAMEDVKLSFGKITFKCPLILLNCFSKYFKDSDEGKIYDFSPYGITAKCFSNIYRWMLTEAIQGQPGLQELNQNLVLEMLNASKQLKITHLEDQCWYYLKITANCEENLAFELYKTSEYNLKEIQQLMLSRICRYFLTLVSSEDYLKLNIDEVVTLLSLNTIGVNSEIEIFYAAILWLNYLWSERKEDDLVQVMDCVRFNLMPPWFLVSLNERTGKEEVDKITEKSFVANKITDAIIFTATQLSSLSGGYEAQDQKLKQISKHLSNQRRWIYDKSCPYHYSKKSDFMDYVSYKTFTNYMKRLREFGKEYWRTLEFASTDHCVRIWQSRPKIKSNPKF